MSQGNRPDRPNDTEPLDLPIDAGLPGNPYAAPPPIPRSTEAESQNAIYNLVKRYGLMIVTVVITSVGTQIVLHNMKKPAPTEQKKYTKDELERLREQIDRKIEEMEELESEKPVHIVEHTAK